MDDLLKSTRARYSFYKPHKFRRASQFSRYLHGTVGSLDRDKNARSGVIKLIKDNTFRAFLAPIKRREL
jgi:hypothetical protein